LFHTLQSVELAPSALFHTREDRACFGVSHRGWTDDRGGCEEGSGGGQLLLPHWDRRLPVAALADYPPQDDSFAINPDGCGGPVVASLRPDFFHQWLRYVAVL
jgi:hypothetical protein